MHVDLDAGRWSFADAPEAVPLVGFDAAVYSVEVGPSGRIYFSNAEAIYRLAPA